MSVRKVVVLPCSGIGKPLGTVSRLAAYRVVEELRPEKTAITCLAQLVAEEAEALALVRENPCIALDGCPKECARRNIEIAGGKVGSELRVMDVFKRHRDLKPETVLDVGAGGNKLASVIAEEIALEADRLLGQVQP
ncbi:MAG: putative zinc-binding protein [bacterium]